MKLQNLLLILFCFSYFTHINVLAQCEAEAGELSSLTIDSLTIDGEELFEIQVNMFGYNADTTYHHFYLLIPYFDPATGQNQTTIQQISLDGNFIVEDPSLHSIMAVSLLAAQLPIPIEDIGILNDADFTWFNPIPCFDNFVIQDLVPTYKNQYPVISFWDENGNGVFDVGELTLDLSYEILGIDTLVQSFTNILSIDQSWTSFDVSPIVNSDLWQNTTISPLVATEADTANTLQFGFTALVDTILQDVSLNTAVTRCNQDINQFLQIRNNGTTISGGQAWYVADENTTVNSSLPIADSMVGDTLFWDFTGLNPTQTWNVILNVDMPNETFTGENIKAYAGWNGTGGGVKLDSIDRILLCSYDPNDKLVEPEGIGEQGYTLFDEIEMEYTVRFQNTGNDTAFNIMIRDNLSEHLDWNTFDPIAASHDVRTEFDIATGIVEFYFENIYLPDSFVNETDSHGFVSFKINRLDPLPENTAIINSADIFFDLNPPIFTNEVMNTFVSEIPLEPTTVAIKAFLEGAYEGEGMMHTEGNALIPVSQPFSQEPYNYIGIETANILPEVVDWVLVEIRRGVPSLINKNTIVFDQKAALLLSNGDIVAPSGDDLTFDLVPGEFYYIALRHRNHLDVLSSQSIQGNGEPIYYDFTVGSNVAFGEMQLKESTDGVKMLYAGDANRDGIIQNSDYDLWFMNNAVLDAYEPTDFNLDGIIQTTDYDQWFLNKAKVGIVELQE